MKREKVACAMWVGSAFRCALSDEPWFDDGEAFRKARDAVRFVAEAAIDQKRLAFEMTIADPRTRGCTGHSYKTTLKAAIQ